MKVYLVGGAVRDLVMDLPVKDKDYVVVGSTAEEMLSLGFQQVGADFPVFLHPRTNEEYALARVERKTGKGYLGFTVVLAILKLIKIVTISWLWVFAPVLISILIAIWQSVINRR